MKYLLVILSSFLPLQIFAQIGIHTESPSATLHIAEGDETVPDGVIAPRLSGEVLRTRNAQYTAAQTGSIVYVTSPSPGAGVADDKTRNINREGYYYYDGNFWQRMSPVEASNGLTAENNLVRLGGTIVQPTTLTAITTQNPLSFFTQGVNSMNINNSLFSVNGTLNRVGIGTTAPQQSLDVEGTMRLNPAAGVNRPQAINQNRSSLFVDRTSGQVFISPEGVPTYSGGFRPGQTYLIGTFRPDNTIARVRFVYHVDNSNDPNNSDVTSYTYGDFVIVGYGTRNPVRFVESSLRGYNGAARALLRNTATEISWSNGVQGNVSLVLNQTNGELRLVSTSPIYSYMFEIFGNM